MQIMTKKDHSFFFSQFDFYTNQKGKNPERNQIDAFCFDKLSL